MLWGLPWSAMWGTEDEMIESMTVAVLPDGPVVTFNPHVGYDQWFLLEIDGVVQGSAIYGRNGRENIASGFWSSPDAEHVISLVPIGDWAIDVGVPYQQDLYQEVRAERINVTITSVPDYATFNESGQLTNWSLTGVKRFSNCEPVKFRPTWGQFDVVISNVSSTRTVKLQVNGTEVGTASRTGDGELTFAAVNNSGIAGTVDIVFTTAETGQLAVRFPAKYAVHFKNSAFTAPDFPRPNPEGTVFDDGHSNEFVFTSARQTADTYRVVTHQIDELANESTGLFGGGATQVTVAVPEPPTLLAYTSGGDQSPATTIQWTASTTSGATYNIYDSEATGILDLGTITLTEGAGTGTITKLLNNITASFTGTRFIVVRSLDGGIEEGNSVILQIEYAAGVRIEPRPPRPRALEPITTVGRKITVPVVVRVDPTKGTPATLELFLFAPDASPSYGSADATVTLGTATGAIIVTNSAGARLVVEFTVASDLIRKWAIRTVTAGGTQSDNTDTYGPVELTTTVPSDPTQVVTGGF